MKNKIKLLSLITALTILMSAIPVNAYAAVPKVNSFSLKSYSESSLTLKWKKAKNVKGYAVYIYDSKSKKYKKAKALSAKSSSVKISKLSSAKTYKFYIKAYKGTAKKPVYGKKSKVISVSTAPSTPKAPQVSASVSSASITWSKVKGASGYEISVTDSATNSTRKLTVNSNSVTIDSLNASSSYSCRIRAYRTLSGKNYYSKSSSAVGFNTLSLPIAAPIIPVSPVSPVIPVIPTPPSEPGVTQTQINENVTFQTMNGFGCSAAWWAQKVGGWEDTQRDIISLLYSSSNGIGLNIYRYNLGAGSINDEALYNKGTRTESFLNDDGTYDFSKDSNAQKSLEIANEINPELEVTLFCNSAPIQYTKNGKAYGDYNENAIESNLSSEHYSDFAKYCFNCVEYFKSKGYNISKLSPINEPEWSWQAYGNGGAGQEGCHFDPGECVNLYTAFIDEASTRELTNNDIQIEIFESGQIGTALFEEYTNALLIETGINGKNNAKIRNHLRTLSCHSYWADTQAKRNARNYLDSSYPKYSYAVTEYCQMIDGTNGLDINYGIDLANVIYDDLTIMNAVEWDWWTGVSNGVYCDGLVYINDSDHSYETSKRLWCLGNFSKFIKKGALRVSANYMNEAVNTCTFKNPDGSLAIIYINNSESSQTAGINISGYSGFSSYVTSDSLNLESFESGRISADSQVNLPAKSVTTVVLK